MEHFEELKVWTHTSITTVSRGLTKACLFHDHVVIMLWWDSLPRQLYSIPFFWTSDHVSILGRKNKQTASRCDNGVTLLWPQTFFRFWFKSGSHFDLWWLMASAFFDPSQTEFMRWRMSPSLTFTLKKIVAPWVLEIKSAFALLIYIFVQNLKVVNNLPQYKRSKAPNGANSI